MERKCERCGKEFTGVGQNELNFTRHTIACQKKRRKAPQKRKISPDQQQTSILKFVKKTVSTADYENREASLANEEQTYREEHLADNDRVNRENVDCRLSYWSTWCAQMN